MADGPHPTKPPPALRAYLLGPVAAAEVEALQRRLAFDVSEGGCPAVVVCEPAAGVSIGRDGSRAHVRLSPEQLRSRGWAVRWVARGGGAVLHLPGQVACYPVLPLESLDLTPADYVAALGAVAVDLFAGFGVRAAYVPGRPGVRVGGRRAAHLGVAVRDGVSLFGLVVNVAPDLEPFRDVSCDGDPAPMTSLQRECPLPVRPQAVRQRLLELVAGRFGFDRTAVFHHHPLFHPKQTRHALAPRSR